MPTLTFLFRLVSKCLFLFTLLNGLTSEAKVTVAFLQIRNYKGDVVQLEPGGRFAHVAISYQGMWLHAHPYRGVEMVTIDKIRQIGEIQEWIEISDLEDLEHKKVDKLLGKPFDHGYLWDDEKIYCAELIAKLIDLQPTPMIFNTEAWPKEYEKLNGLPGMSPDDIFEILSARQKLL